MAHPKRQHSKQRQRLRRGADNYTVASVGVCSQCKKAVLPHRVCPFCGYYKGKPVVEIKAPKETKKEN